MKHPVWLSIIFILCGLLITPAAVSHPYDSPLTFRKHLTNDGRVIYSNIPKKCFADGILICGGLHPVMGGSAIKGASSDEKQSEQD